MLLSAGVAWFTAQVLKTLIHMILNKTFHIGRACPPALGWDPVRLYAHQYVGILI